MLNVASTIICFLSNSKHILQYFRVKTTANFVILEELELATQQPGQSDLIPTFPRT